MNNETRLYMLDTGIFNSLLDGAISVEALPAGSLLVTGVQADELGATPNQDRRAQLLAMFHQVRPTIVHAASFVWEIEGAGLDQAHWNDGSGTFPRMLGRLQELDKGKPKRKDLKNQLRDVVIAETAIKNHATLISNDENLRTIVLEFGGYAINL